ncbi:permease-like cell division protein FtsX [Thermomonas flagellata]|uniref:permease-like cell division protein FtsX n=1 Tax=Thermomonas flagellata TaxID=2888524 RepID=UPI001F0406B2|nr:permease-like cell division protein FtsX [Thermomonas flagellata]
MPELPPSASAPAVVVWFDRHLQSLLASLGRLLRRPWATVLTVAVMALALALPLGLWLGLENLARLAGPVQAAGEVTAFLRPGAPAADAEALAARLRARGDVAAVAVVTPAQALAQLRTQADVAAAIAALGEAAAQAALPPALEVRPRGDAGALAAALAGMPEVARVVHDAAWQQRLRAWLAFGRRLALVLAVLFGLGAVLVVGNTVRLDIQARRREIEVLQLLGASDGFVRRPFLYLGAWYGLAAGALALAVLAGVDQALRAPLAALAASYASTFALTGLDLPRALLVLAGAGLLGWLGAALAVGHHLRRARAGVRA